MININNISYKIANKYILKNISANIETGKITAIIGANGAGKSTLLKCITGILEPSNGQVVIDNKPIQSYSLQELAKRRAVLSQSNQISFPFTAIEIVLMGRCPHIIGRETKQDLEIAQLAMHKLEIYDLKNRIYSSLSGGEQQRVQVARTLAQIWDKKNSYIFLDEPTSALDLNHQHKLMIIMKELCQEGNSVICILHDINLVRYYADSLLILQNGHLYRSGSIKNTFTIETIQNAYNLNADMTKKILCE